jgi:hypothetical protein
MIGYLASDYKNLNDEERRAVLASHYIMNGDGDPGEFNDEQMEEAFGLLFPCQGCVPEAYIGDSLHDAIRKKFAAMYSAAAHMVEEDLEASGFKYFDIRAIIDVSVDDCTYIAIVDWRDKWPARYYNDSCKAWHFQCESFKDLATDILKVRDEILRAFKENRELQLQLGRLGRDV